MAGKLILLSVPIGNSEDITVRAKKALEQKTHFAVEDTRVFVELLRRLAISTDGKKIISFHDHSSLSREDEIFNLIGQNLDVCIVSDAGSPVISDPAFPLVRSCWEKGIEIESYPGVSAVIVALELMALPPSPFIFHGFLARDEGKVREFLNSLRTVRGTHLFFESPHRVLNTIDSMAEIYPSELMGIGRELTKTHHTVHRFIGEDWGKEKEKVTVLGEFVVGIHISKEEIIPLDLKKAALKVLESKGKSKELAKLLGGILEVDPKEIYGQLIR